MKKPLYRTLLLLALALIAIAIITSLSPAEKTLGVNVRVVYLHGAWVWVALLTLIAAGVAGLAGLLLKRPNLYLVSRALARSGMFFWITYLPLSLWAMQTNWNGLFLAEPRWRLAITFAISGFLLQLGLTLVQRPRWDAALNAVFITTLMLTLQFTPNVMHPPAPIQESGVFNIQFFFYLLVAVTAFASIQVSRIFYLFPPKHILTE